RYAHARNKSGQHLARRRCLQIFDDMRLDARIADHRQRVARGAAIGIVIDDDVHGRLHAALLRGDDAPSDWPISVSLVRSDALSRLATGRDVKAEMRFFKKRKAATKAASFWISGPSTAAGSSIPQ